MSARLEVFCVHVVVSEAGLQFLSAVYDSSESACLWCNGLPFAVQLAVDSSHGIRELERVSDVCTPES